MWPKDEQEVEVEAVGCHLENWENLIQSFHQNPCHLAHKVSQVINTDATVVLVLFSYPESSWISETLSCVFLVVRKCPFEVLPRTQTPILNENFG